MRFAVLLSAIGFVLLLAACGGSDTVARDEFRPAYQPPPGATRGGVLRVLASGDVDSFDPGAAQNQFAVMVSSAIQRTLLMPSPREGEAPVPDLAAEPPEVDRENGVVRFRIRDDVRFSPPLDRPVVARDFEYAIERSLLPGVANGYVDAYLGTLVGFRAARAAATADPRRAPDIDGVSAPGHTLVLRFRGEVPPLSLEVLSLPLGAPVPYEYARPFDAEIPSGYDRHLVGTGPYMIDLGPDGEQTGHRPGIETELVRNPNWDPATDTRPAFLDGIVIENGYGNTTAASRKILGGESMVSGDFAPDPPMLRYAATERPDQLTLVPAGASTYASLNTTIDPLDDPDVRRAIVAATDRQALRLVRGGEMVGPLATHFIPPGVPGFREAGGLEGPDLEFLDHPAGDPVLAARYMRRAGYPDGTYTGDAELLLVTDSTGIGRRVGELVRQAIASLGIDVRTRVVARDVMYSRYCNVPAAEVAVCPNVGWVRQLDDGQVVLAETFGGDAIREFGNSNWPQLSDPLVDRWIRRATWIGDREDRARAWARIDRRVTSLAAAIPGIWAQVPIIASRDVALVVDRTNANPSLTSTSLTGEGE